MNFLFMYHDRPNYSGGPIVNAKRLLPELVRRGHKVHCLILYAGGNAPSLQYLTNKGVTCYSLPFDLLTKTLIPSILKLVDTVGPDVFIPNLSVPGWYAARWVRQAGIPTIACHRSNDEFHWAMVDEFIMGRSEWAVSGVVCVNEEIFSRIRSLSPSYTDLCVIPSGVPLPKSMSAQKGPLRLVYVGHLTQNPKRILDLIDGVRPILQLQADISVTLIGDGPDRERVQKKILEYNLDKRIQLLGTVSSDRIQQILTHHHVLVLLSSYEGTPGAVMDGMAAGLVPVCINIPGGVRELVLHEQTGLLIDDRNKSFHDAIIRLTNDSVLRSKLALNARRHIEKYYSLEGAANSWELFCERLLSNSGTKQKLEIPSRFALPKRKQAFKREDKRRILFPLYTINSFRQFLRSFYRT